MASLQNGAGNSRIQLRTKKTNHPTNAQTKMIPMTTSKSIGLLAGGLVLAITSSVYAQEKPFTLPGTALPVPPPPPPKPAEKADAPVGAKAAPEPNPIDQFFNGKIPDTLAKGKFNHNARLR
jgi:hypothetical protein